MDIRGRFQADIKPHCWAAGLAIGGCWRIMFVRRSENVKCERWEYGKEEIAAFSGNWFSHDGIWTEQKLTDPHRNLHQECQNNCRKAWILGLRSRPRYIAQPHTTSSSTSPLHHGRHRRKRQELEVPGASSRGQHQPMCGSGIWWNREECIGGEAGQWVGHMRNRSFPRLDDLDMTLRETELFHDTQQSYENGGIRSISAKSLRHCEQMEAISCPCSFLHSILSDPTSLWVPPEPHTPGEWTQILHRPELCEFPLAKNQYRDHWKSTSTSLGLGRFRSTRCRTHRIDEHVEVVMEGVLHWKLEIKIRKDAIGD